MQILAKLDNSFLIVLLYMFFTIFYILNDSKIIKILFSSTFKFFKNDLLLKYS